MSEQHAVVFGIDLGTTYSCIAYVDDTGRPVILSNLEGDSTTPSVVFFDGADRVVGKIAKNHAEQYPDQVVSMVKRQMGEADYRFSYQGEEYRASEISAYILRKVAGDVESTIGRPAKDVVITCPAYFGLVEKTATKQAGEIAGLNVVGIVTEPTAAALAYGLTADHDQVILVYDLGGGTFDITMINITGGAFRQIATGGNDRLGGRQWDERLVEHVAAQWMSETGSSENPMASPETLEMLYAQVEQGKMALTAKDSTQIAVNHNGQRASIRVTREQFDSLTSDLLEQTIQQTRALLQAAKKKGIEHFDQLLLVGGSTLMPQVKERVQREFGVEPKVFEPHHAVAKGAAIYGLKQVIEELLEKEIERLKQINPAQDAARSREQALETVAEGNGLTLPAIRDIVRVTTEIVSPRSFGVIARKQTGTTRTDIVFNLIKRNDPLPADVTQRFFTEDQDQREADIHFMEALSDEGEVEPELATEIGTAVLELPPGLPAGTPIEITFQLDKEGLLHAIARELTSGRLIEVDIKTTGTGTEAEVAQAQARSRGVTVS